MIHPNAYRRTVSRNGICHQIKPPCMLVFDTVGIGELEIPEPKQGTLGNEDWGLCLQVPENADSWRSALPPLLRHFHSMPTLHQDADPERLGQILDYNAAMIILCGSQQMSVVGEEKKNFTLRIHCCQPAAPDMFMLTAFPELAPSTSL